MKLDCLCCFSGIGGMGMLLPVRHVMMVERDPYARMVLEARMAEGMLDKVPIHDDIRTLTEPPPHDILIAGFPCQDLSIAGGKAGFGGKKSVLFYEVARLAQIARPKYVFLENVQNIINMTTVWQSVLREMSRLGYDMYWTLMAAGHAGAPQKRMRWFCYCVRRRELGEVEMTYGREKMPKNGQCIQGICSEVDGHELPMTKLARPLIFRALEGVPCRSKVCERDVERYRWCTPRASGGNSATRNMTSRGIRDIASQLRFEVNTKERHMHHNPDWVDWLMGLPVGWTDVQRERTENFPGWKREPCKRMSARRPHHYTERCRCLGNMCVPQTARLAYDVLTRRVGVKIQEEKQSI